MTEPGQRPNPCIPPLVEAERLARVRASVLHADWRAPARVRAFTTLRGPGGQSAPPFDRLNMGARGGDDAASVARNRDDLFAGLELPAPPHWLQQVHGSDVVVFEGRAEAAPPVSGWTSPSPEDPIADAAVATVPGVVLAIQTADCLPVLFCSEPVGTVGAAHAGWRGMASGVLEYTVRAMRTPPSRVLAWLGPAAGPGAYEVGEDVRAAFADADAGCARAFAPTRPGHWHCDLYALARRRLETAGVTRVWGGGLCTISDPQRFYSYRRDVRTGRMASLIWINPGQPDA